MPETAKPKLTPRRPRPEVGSVTTKIVDLRVCKACGCLVGDTGMCGWECLYDGDHAMEPDTTWFIARYEVTEKFLGDFE